MIITVVYVISTLTHDALAMILHLKSDLECDLTFTSGTIYYTFFWTVFLNNVSNPFIYGLSDDRFSSLVKELFRKKDSGFSRATLTKGRSNSNRSSTLSSMLTPRQNTLTKPYRQSGISRKQSVVSRSSTQSSVFQKQPLNHKNSQTQEVPENRVVVGRLSSETGQ